MSNLQEILEQAKAGLKPWEPIPEVRWQTIADACGAAEFHDIEGRIQNLKNELEETPEWDGDTQDDINRALWFSNICLRPVQHDMMGAGQKQSFISNFNKDF